MRIVKQIIIVVFLFVQTFMLAQDEKKEDTDAKAKSTPADAFGALLAAGNAKADSAAQRLKNKDEKAAEKFYQSAIKDYKKALKINQTSFVLYTNLAKAQTKIKDFKGAAQSYKEATTLDSIHSDPFREYGKALILIGKYDEGLAELEKAIAINYDDFEAFFERGKLRETAKDKAPALEDYARAIEIKPNYEAPYLKRGILYNNVKKDYVLALNDLNKVIEINKNNVDAYLWRGKAKYNLGDFKGADKDLSRYLEEDMFNIDALLTRGASRININNYTGAIEDFDEVIRLDPKNYIAYMNRGTAHGGLKKFNEAMRDLDMAITIKFDYSPSYINRASIKFATGDKKGACKDLEKADGLNNEKAYPLIQKYCNEGNR